MAVVPRSAGGTILIAAGGILLVCILLMALSALLRSASWASLPHLAAMFLLPLLAMFLGVIATVVLAWDRKWWAALAAAVLMLALVLGAGGPIHQEIYRSFVVGAQQLEFLAQRTSYDAVVARTPKAETPPLFRVSSREVCCSWIAREEIWFDESDALGSTDDAVRRGRLSFHPQRPDQRRPLSYLINPLGGHYYLIELGDDGD